MGGVVPLGYRVERRALHIVEEHAALIRSFYDRYLALGSVVRLKAELEEREIRVPQQIDGTGKVTGGGVFSRGHLHGILANPIYAGPIGQQGDFRSVGVSDSGYPDAPATGASLETGFGPPETGAADRPLETQTHRQRPPRATSAKLTDGNVRDIRSAWEIGNFGGLPGGGTSPAERVSSTVDSLWQGI